MILTVPAQEFEGPDWPGAANAEYSEWLNFATAEGDISPDVEGSTGDAVLRQTAPGAIATGSGNIYNPAGVSTFEVADSADSALQTVVFQSRTTGTELDYDGLVLEYNDGETQTLTATREELFREAGGLGDTVVSKWTFDLTGLAVQEFTIRVSSLGAHTSLVSARLDTQFGAEPKPLAFDEPDWFEDANTEYAGWLNFTTPVGEPGNSPDVDGSTGDGILTQTVPGASITSTMNIYNPAGASIFEITDSVDASLQTIVFQSWTTGTELDYDSLVLEYIDGEIQTLSSAREEVGRLPGGFGDEVVSKWSFDLTGLDVQEFTIRVSSLGAHTSLVAARLDAQLEPSGPVFQIVKTSPDLDRWNYPFNATPGTRTAAPVFQAEYETHFDRYGNYVLGFDTSDVVTSGAAREAYVIESARLIATTTSNFEIAYDPTIDSVFTFLPEDNEQYVSDEDAGRPVELFGAGFRNGFDVLTWEETTPFAPEDAAPTVFPASVNEGGEIIDVTEAVNFETPVESIPFAIGTLDSVTPGELVPYDTAMTFELNVSDPIVQSYLQLSLSAGRVFFTITGLPEGVQGATTRTYPEFATRENLVSNPPVLEMTVRVVEVPTVFEIASLGFTTEGNVMISFIGAESGNYQIRHTSNFSDWQTIENPVLSFPGFGVVQWADETPASDARFYQIITLE